MATIITNVNELQNISLDLAGDYELGNDINASGFAFTMLGGTFTGSLDGMGFDINDLTITVIGGGTKYGALIKINQGTIKNLRLVNCAISITSTTLNALAASLVRQNDVTGVIENCSATGTVIAIGAAGSSHAAGLVAINDGQIDDSYSEVITSVNAPIATAAGFIIENIGVINNSYARGNATANTYASGFISKNFAGGVITNAYSTGKPIAATIAGFCRVNNGTITACFWDIETSETEISDGGTGKPTSQMKIDSTFINAGWDFTTTWNISYGINDRYPYLFGGGIIVRALAAINITETTATLFGRLVYDGGAACECRFRYKKEGEAYNYTTWANSKSTGDIFTANLTGLTGTSIYEFAAQAKNPVIGEWSASKLFVTLSPRREKPIEDKPTLELIRNIEMAARGRFFTDEEGKAVYKSRYARNP